MYWNNSVLASNLIFSDMTLCFIFNFLRYDTIFHIHTYCDIATIFNLKRYLLSGN